MTSVVLGAVVSRVYLLYNFKINCKNIPTKDEKWTKDITNAIKYKSLL